MGASQGKKKQESSSTKQAVQEDVDVTIDPQSSAALAQKLAQNKRLGANKQMPWNETEGDDDMNDREGQNRNSSQPVQQWQREANQTQQQMPAGNNMTLNISPQRPAERHGNNRNNNNNDDNSLDDIERQIAAIEQAHARVENGQDPNRVHQNSLESGESEQSANEEVKEGEDAMFNAIVASLIEYTGQEGAGQPELVKKAEENEDRQIKEVIALSKLENDKKTGKLNLDFLKRGNKTSPRAQAQGSHETPAAGGNLNLDIKATPASIIPPATTTATYVVKAGPGQQNSNLPPPAMVTAVVRQVPVPELSLYSQTNNNLSSKNILAQPASLVPMGDLQVNEESKFSPRLAAPKSLAPLASKSKATLAPLSLPSAAATVPNIDSKLSQIPNIESENETEFESAKTLMPGHGQVDEIGALLGHDKSIAEMKTSFNTRSPGPSMQSNKLQSYQTGALETSSVIQPADESTYAAHQVSNRDEESVMGQMIGLSPDHPSNRNMRAGNTSSLTKNKYGTDRQFVDEYEDLLNTIEQENSQRSKNVGVDANTNKIDLKSGRASGSVPSTMTMDRAGNSQTVDRHEEEPIIDFELEQEMIDLTDKQKKKEQTVAAKRVVKKNLNESSDFDLDNY